MGNELQAERALWNYFIWTVAKPLTGNEKSGKMKMPNQFNKKATTGYSIGRAILYIAFTKTLLLL